MPHNATLSNWRNTTRLLARYLSPFEIAHSCRALIVCPNNPDCRALLFPSSAILLSIGEGGRARHSVLLPLQTGAYIESPRDPPRKFIRTSRPPLRNPCVVPQILFFHIIIQHWCFCFSAQSRTNNSHNGTANPMASITKGFSIPHSCTHNEN